ncbi:MAG: hypothetical protein ABI770_05380 [Sphingomicrobium sp.]
MSDESGWSDVCILNVSSRGLQIRSIRGAAPGSTVELRHGDHVIVARVVWHNGTRAGLRAEDRVPVETIVIMARAAEVQPQAAALPVADRRKRPRTHEEHRLRSRALEFASVGLIAIVLAATVFSMVEQAFAPPLAMVRTALGG